MLTVERNTSCTSIFMHIDEGEEEYTLHDPHCWWWKGIHSARPYNLHACPHCRRCRWEHPARPPTRQAVEGIQFTPCTSILLVVEMNTPCMSIVHTAGDGKKYTMPVYLLVVLVRDTPCMSTLLAMIERDTRQV
jgi:hypothetical protein